jgi:hypothetical protein
MKNCKDIVDLATEYLENSMESTFREEFEKHISLCPPCEVFFNTYRATGPLCRKAIARRIPHEVQSALWQFLEQRINSDE